MATWISASLNRSSLSLVWWNPRGERLIGHVDKGLGRGDGKLHPHTNGASVPHQRHGAQRQHPGLRQRRLHCQDLGHQDGPVPANTARWVHHPTIPEDCGYQVYLNICIIETGSYKCGLTTWTWLCTNNRSNVTFCKCFDDSGVGYAVAQAQ